MLLRAKNWVTSLISLWQNQISLIKLKTADAKKKHARTLWLENVNRSISSEWNQLRWRSSVALPIAFINIISMVNLECQLYKWLFRISCSDISRLHFHIDAISFGCGWRRKRRGLNAANYRVRDFYSWNMFQVTPISKWNFATNGEKKTGHFAFVILSYHFRKLW